MIDQYMIDIFIKEHRLPPFRIKQFDLAYYKDFIVSFDKLTTWPKELREKSKKTVSFSTIKPIKEIKSADHGISNTFRVTMGDDIKAACGQLTTQ